MIGVAITEDLGSAMSASERRGRNYMTLNDHNADDMLKGTLMQNKPSELFLHYYKYHSDLVSEVVRFGLWREEVPNSLVEEMDEHNIDKRAIYDEIIRSREAMPSLKFH